MSYRNAKKTRCKGDGAEYRSGIKLREARSLGKSSSVPFPRIGRMVQTLSDGELRWLCHFWWDDNVKDIKEQLFLDDDIVAAICTKLGLHPRYGLTTDFLVIYQDGTKVAYSIKLDENFKEDKKQLQHVVIEKMYWESLGVKFLLRYKNQISRTEYENILDVMPYWNEERICDDFGIVRHLIARKAIPVDITKEIDIKAMLDEYAKEINAWKNRFLESSSKLMAPNGE